MSQNPTPNRRPLTYTAIGTSVGLLFGAILGLIADNLTLFAGGGLVLGFALGSALDARKQ